MKLKHKLPLYSEIEHANLSQDELIMCQNLVKTSDSEFKSVLDVNSQLCRYHSDLTQDSYDSMLQINVTDSVYENETLNIDEFKSKSLLGSYKEKMTLAMTSDSVFSEHSFTKPTDIHESNKELFSSILGKFMSPASRIRLVKLPSGKTIAPHIDYDPSYAVRIIIPIMSDHDCINIFWYKNAIQTVNLEEGKAYFLNTGYRHAVCNFSKNSRYTLMISLNGHDDLRNIIMRFKNVCI